MPKYTFQCPKCELQFELTLKAGAHETHDCPQCHEPAPRYWPGQSFATSFQEGAVPGNSGVAKLDYPTADQAVGSDADKKWGQYAERGKVKDRVRNEAGTHKLVRRHVEGDIEYKAMTDQQASDRRKLAKDAVAKLRESPAQ